MNNDWESLTCEEIAIELGWKLGKVKSVKQRAMNKLRDAARRKGWNFDVMMGIIDPVDCK